MPTRTDARSVKLLLSRFVRLLTRGGTFCGLGRVRVGALHVVSTDLTSIFAASVFRCRGPTDASPSLRGAKVSKVSKGAATIHSHAAAGYDPVEGRCKWNYFTFHREGRVAVLAFEDGSLARVVDEKS